MIKTEKSNKNQSINDINQPIKQQITDDPEKKHTLPQQEHENASLHSINDAEPLDCNPKHNFGISHLSLMLVAMYFRGHIFWPRFFAGGRWPKRLKFIKFGIAQIQNQPNKI